MPFKSQAQARYMFAKHPKIAKEFAKHTPDFSSLPEHADMEMGNSILAEQDGLEMLNRHFIYMRNKENAYRENLKSERPAKEQTTLKEFK